MTSGQKIAFSTLISIALFGAFAFFTRTGFIPQIENRFYAQAKIQQKVEQIDNVSESLDSYIQKILTEIESGENAYLKSVSVSSYLSQNPAESDTVERRNITEKLFYENPALNGIRFIDKNGRNIHFSTYDRTDVAKHVGIKKQYKNYTDIIESEKEIDFRTIFSENHVPEQKLYFDADRNRFFIVIPVNWLENVYAGCFIFYFDLQNLENQLIEENVLPYKDSLTLISDKNYKGGFVLGIPSDEKTAFSDSINDFWKTKKQLPAGENIRMIQPEKLLSIKDGRFWMILNSTGKYDFSFSGVYTSDIFELSQELIYLIYISLFISIFLVIFLLFSLKRDSMLVLQKRIKKLQYGIIKEYLNNQEKVEWSTVANQLKIRNSEISQEIRRSLGKKNKYKSEEIDAILDKSWNEIIDVVTHYSGGEKTVSENENSVSSSGAASSGVTLEQIRDLMKELLQTTTVNVANVSNVAAKKGPSVKPVTSSSPAEVAVSPKVSVASSSPVSEEEVEEIEEIDEIDEVEELSDEVEEIEEIAELEDAVEELGEELDEVEPLEDEVDEVEPLEDEVDEVEPLEDELEEVEELSDVEEIDEVESVENELEDVEEINDVGEVEEVEELDDIDDAEDVESLEEVEELDDELEEVEEIETIDEVEKLSDEVEEIAEVEELDEDLDEVKELNQTDEAGAVEELSDVEEIDEVEPVENELEEVEEISDVEEIEPVEQAEDIPDIEINPAMFMAMTGGADFSFENLRGDVKDVMVHSDEEFISVDNLLLEELCIGPEIKTLEKNTVSPLTVYSHKEVPEQQVEELGDVEDLEEVTEAIPEAIPVNASFTNQFSMVQFGLNVGEVQELQEDNPSQTITENEGVFSISQNLEYSHVQQNPDFKKLVDSVLHL